MLVTSIFSFSHNVSYLVTDKFCHFSHIEIVVCKCFEFGQVVWWRVTPYPKIPIYKDFWEIGVWKKLGKWRKCRRQAFSPFPELSLTFWERDLFLQTLFSFSSSNFFIIYESEMFLCVDFLLLDKILDRTKLKALSDDKIYVTRSINFHWERL